MTTCRCRRSSLLMPGHRLCCPGREVAHAQAEVASIGGLLRCPAGARETSFRRLDEEHSEQSNHKPLGLVPTLLPLCLLKTLRLHHASISSVRQGIRLGCTACWHPQPALRRESSQQERQTYLLQHCWRPGHEPEPQRQRLQHPWRRELEHRFEAESPPRARSSQQRQRQLHRRPRTDLLISLQPI